MHPDLDVVRSLTIIALREFQQTIGKERLQECGCAQFVQWVATFVPEAFDDILRGRLSDYLMESRELKPDCWYDLIPLQAGMFALSDNLDWLDPLIAHWDDDNSAVRRHVHITAALIADRMTFYDAALLTRTRDNLVKHHFFNDYPLLILAASRGNKNDKVEHFKDWTKTIELRGQDPALLATLIADEPICNTLLTDICRVQSYVLLRMTTSCQTGEGQDRIFGSAQVYTQEELAFPKAPVHSDLFERIMSRMELHPLLQTMVRVVDLD